MVQMFNHLIIAEIGSVHDGSFGNALKLIDLANSLGANAVKFQTHIAEEETTDYAPNPDYFNSEDRFSYFKRTSFSFDEWQTLKTHAEDKNMIFISSAFSLKALEMLENLGVSMHKVPSGEVTNIPLLEAMSETKKPVLLSSGMSSWKELDQAVGILKGKVPLCVMQCSSQYPCENQNVGLNIINEMMHRYQVPIGFSDHTVGYAAPIAAAALGAICVEKHLTFSRYMYGSDAVNATEPNEFRGLVKSLNDVWDMCKNPVNKDDTLLYTNMKGTFEKSIVAAHFLQKGQIIRRKDISFKKPGNGLSTSFIDKLIGKKINVDLEYDQQILLEHLIDE